MKNNRGRKEHRVKQTGFNPLLGNSYDNNAHLQLKETTPSVCEHGTSMTAFHTSLEFFGVPSAPQAMHPFHPTQSQLQKWYEY